MLRESNDPYNLTLRGFDVQSPHIYDAYGTLEELKHFTEAIEGFENSKITNHGLVLYVLNYIYIISDYVFYLQVGYQHHRSPSIIYETLLCSIIRCVQRN